MPEHALYYPETTISDPGYLFDALLYWEGIKCIVPWKNFSSESYYHSQAMKKAMALALEEGRRDYLPTPKQKSLAHDLVKGILASRRPRGRGERSEMGRLYVSKLDPLTLQLLVSGGWLDHHDSGRDQVESYLKKRKRSQGTYPPNFHVELPRGLSNLIMHALVSVCSSDRMPPVTPNIYEFSNTINELLRNSSEEDFYQLGESREPISNKLADFSPSVSEANISGDLRFLFATIPRLGCKNPYEVTPGMLKKLVEARSKPDIRGYQAKFRKTVDKYLGELGDAEEPERKDIRESFANEARRDLKALKKELRSASLTSLVPKEGLIGATFGYELANMAPGATPELLLISSCAAAILGVFRGGHLTKKDRQAALTSHWSSWVMSAENRRFSLW